MNALCLATVLETVLIHLLATLTQVQADPQPDVSTSESNDRAPLVRHIVRPRETVEQLAYRYKVHPRHILRSNKLDDGDTLESGETLRLRSAVAPPPRQRMTHIVQEGDTWVSIARAHGAESTDLRAYNLKTVGRTLEPGERVLVWADPTLKAAYEHDQPPTGPAGQVRPGAFSIGPPQEGRLINGVRIPKSDQYDLRYPNSAWGTTLAVRNTVIACHDFRDITDYRGDLRIGTMSRKRGGPVGGHKSHQSGRDLDIRLPLRETVPQRLSPRPHRVDWVATWELIKAFARTGAVIRVFLDYKRQRRLVKAARAAGATPEELDDLVQWPRGSRANLGLVRHSHGHTGHIHIRFACAPHEVECVE